MNIDRAVVYYQQLVISNRALNYKSRQVVRLRRQLQEEKEKKTWRPIVLCLFVTSLVLLVAPATIAVFGVTAILFASAAALVLAMIAASLKL